MRATLILTCLVLSGAATGHAQQSSPAALQPGQRAIEFALPEGGGTQVGLWWVRSPQMQLGISGGFQYSTSETMDGRSRNTWQVQAGPALKRHVAVSGPIVPHWRASAMVGFAGGDDRSDTTVLTLAGGFGADWFPVDRVSVGGHMGVQLGHNRVTATTLPAGERRTATATGLNTFRSGLMLQFYF